MLVPKDHLLRKIDAAIDFTHIYKIVRDLYCEDNQLCAHEVGARTKYITRRNIRARTSQKRRRF